MKINAKGLAKSQIFSNTFYRNLLIEKTWKKYHNYVENVFCSTTTNIFSFFFYFLTGFLRTGLRRTVSFRLRDFFINTDVLKFYIGQTHFFHSTDSFYFFKSVQDYPDLFINPLLFVRLGNTYFDRAFFSKYVSDCSGIVDLVNSPNENVSLFGKEILLLSNQLNQTLLNFYTSMTFSY